MIACPDSGYENDVYAHKSVVAPEMLELGDVLAFPLHVNARGMPQASSPIFKAVGRDHESEAAEFGQFLGQVDRILPNGNGFMKCPQVEAAFGTDAFIHS